MSNKFGKKRGTLSFIVSSVFNFAPNSSRPKSLYESTLFTLVCTYAYSFSYFSSLLINFLAEDVDTVLPVENAHNVDSVDVGMCPYLLLHAWFVEFSWGNNASWTTLF